MQIPLERLPPLFSHMFCVFIGMLTTLYTSSETTAQECFLDGRIFIAFPTQYFADKAFESPSPGHKVYFAKQKDTLCLFKKAAAVIVQSEPFVVAVLNMRDADLVSELFHKKNKGLITLLREKDLMKFQKCTDGHIHYGP